MKRRTILHTIETGGPGGAETVLVTLASRLDPTRYRSVTLLPRRGWLSEALESKGVAVHIAKSKSWRDPTLLAEMRRLIRQEAVDLIHSHLPDQNFYGCVAGLLARRPTIATYHGLPPARETLSLRAKAKLRFVRRFAAATVVVSGRLEDAMRELGFPARRLVRIYNGIDVSQFAQVPTGWLRRELGRNGETKLVGMVANVRAAKGYDYFLQAASEVARRVPEAMFLAIGQAKNGELEELRAQVRRLSLEERFAFLGFRRDVPEILAELDLFVLSSVREGFSLATVEAMAAGKPVVATRSGGPEEIVDHPRTGLLVPAQDAGALAAGIYELLRDPARAKAMGRAAREKAALDFSAEAMIRRYEALYERVLKEAA
jgi:glycosyltransferase involved in cell wall biosynthesis